MNTMIAKAVVGALALAMVHVPSGPRAAELVMLEEQGCDWCERWTDEVGAIYDRSTEGRIAPLRRLDIHDRLPPDLTFLDKGRYTPTFILVDGGREIGRIRGYPGEDFFWGYLRQLIDKLAKPMRRAQLAK